MPRYFFDFRHGKQVAPDEEGLFLPDMDAVENEAAHALVDMTRDAMMSVDNGLAREMAVEVRDEIGPVLHATFNFDMKRLQ